MLRKTALPALLLLLVACSDKPEPIFFGEDNCSYCRMQISDVRYGGELITNKGKAYKFDSAECMTAYILKNHKGSDDTKSLWVIDFKNPENLTDAKSAVYLHSEKLGSPMGMNLTAFANLNDAEIVAKEYSGEIIRWDDVKNIVSEKWLTKEH